MGGGQGLAEATILYSSGKLPSCQGLKSDQVSVWCVCWQVEAVCRTRGHGRGPGVGRNILHSSRVLVYFGL
jgi:hypothetical protein